MKTLVVHFIDSMAMGGAECLVRDYVCLLDKLKFKSIVLIPSYKKNYQNEQFLKNEGIELISLQDIEVKNLPERIIIFNRLYRKILTYMKLSLFLKKYSPKIIHCHLNVNRYLLLPLKSLKKCKLYYTVHSAPKLTFKKKTYYYITKILIRLKKLQIIGLHEDMVKELNELFHIKNCMLVSNGIIFSRFKNIHLLPNQAKNRLGIDEGSFVVGNIGRFVTVKNHEYLVKVFQAVRAIKNNSLLLLCGEGPKCQEITQSLIKLGLEENYIVLKNRDDIPKILRAMDVFVFPSIAEGFGLALLEAQVMGVKCVASDIIPSELCLSPNYISLSLDLPPEVWANNIISTCYQNEKYGDIYKYDLTNIIKNLESRYLVDIAE